MPDEAFLGRLFARLRPPGDSFHFDSWKHGGRPTSEGLGVLPIQVDVDEMVERILDVNHYAGNIEHVVKSRAIADPSFSPPTRLRFYQRLKIPLLGEVQFENAMEDLGERDGWRVVTWQLLEDATDRLNTRNGARFDYNDGAWLLRPDAVGYALSSAPRKKDVGRIKFAVMTRGADASASIVLRGNIEGMARWAAGS